MSPRAACRLEALGFQHLYDYVAGIADWKAAGLPIEGSPDNAQRVADATRVDIPTCRPDESLADAQARTFAAGWDECVVIDCGHTVVGRLRNQSWDASTTTAEEAMEPGPSTVRPDQLLAPLIERMTRYGTTTVVVTSPQGTLIGAVRREDAGQLLAGIPPEQIWRDCEGCPGRWAIHTPSSSTPA